MQIKTSELVGSALDWAVAKSEGAMYCLEISPTRNSWESMGGFNARYSAWKGDGFGMDRPAYSTDWAQGGPIIEREITKLFRNVGGTYSAMILKDVPIPPEERGTGLALTYRAQWNGSGPAPLIAAMRCLVASKLGDTVDIPYELIS